MSTRQVNFMCSLKKKIYSSENLLNQVKDFECNALIHQNFGFLISAGLFATTSYSREI